MKTLTFLAEFLLPRAGIEPARAMEFASTDLVETGLIDSLGVIEMIGLVEAEYGIQFSTEQMQDSRFRTMSGLAEIIDETVGT